MTSVLLAMALEVWMHKPDVPGLLVVRIIEKHLLSTDASREAPVDKCARRQCVYTCVPDLDVGQKEKQALSTGASREAPVDKSAPRHGA